MMLCVLSLTQAAAQEVTVKKVDQHAPPPPEEVDDDVRDRLVVTDEQGGRGLAVSVFLLSHIGFILRRFFPQLLWGLSSAEEVPGQSWGCLQESSELLRCM